jgi:hypothetical protein
MKPLLKLALEYQKLRTSMYVAFQITSLLKRALISKQPFTGLYFDIPITPDNVNQVELPEMLSPKLGPCLVSQVGVC